MSETTDPDAERGQVTRLLHLGGPGRDDLLDLVYGELRQIAQRRITGERKNHTLQATALVHEAYLKLVDEDRVAWQGRGQFYGAAAEAMRRVLIDHARKVKSAKRGGEFKRVTLGAAEMAMEVSAERIIDLSDALEKLAGEDPRSAEVARLRFLSGLTIEEVAFALELSERTVHREWTYARARLVELMGDEDVG